MRIEKKSDDYLVGVKMREEKYGLNEGMGAAILAGSAIGRMVLRGALSPKYAELGEHYFRITNAFKHAIASPDRRFDGGLRKMGGDDEEWAKNAQEDYFLTIRSMDPRKRNLLNRLIWADFEPSGAKVELIRAFKQFEFFLKKRVDEKK